MQPGADGVQLAPFGKEPEIRILDPRREGIKGLIAIFENARIAEADEPRLEMLGELMAVNGVMDEPPREIALADARLCPRNHLRRQNAANLQLLANAQQERIHSGR